MDSTGAEPTVTAGVAGTAGVTGAAGAVAIIDVSGACTASSAWTPFET